MTCVLSKSAIDMLAHVCVRARNLKVLFAVCFDDEGWNDLERLDGKLIKVTGTSRINVE